MQKLQAKLGYTFKDLTYLERALTHSSIDMRTEEGKPFNNERMEFLGDRVLGLAIANLVYETFGDEKEGRLAKRHTTLVRQEALAYIATQVDLGRLIVMSSGEEKSGGREKPSILSDAMEAVIAAIYLDGGYQPAEAFIREYWSPLLQGVKGVRLKDAKSQLQEFLQKHKKMLPKYTLVDTQGEAHDRTFTISVIAEGYGEAVGEGSSKQQAEQKAALALLEKLGEA